MLVKDMHGKLQAALLAARGIAEKAEKEQREFTAEERVALEGHLKEAQDWKAKLQDAKQDAEMRRMLAEMGMDASGEGLKGQEGGPSAEKGTLGERFVNSDVFKGWMKQFPNGQIPDSYKGLNCPPVTYKSIFGRKALITGASDTSAGAFVQTDVTGIYEPLGRLPRTMRQLVDMRQTDSDTVEFVRQTVQVTQAAPVPEANVTDYTGATGQVSGEKPEATLAYEKVTTNVKTIAVWIPATKRALSDAAQIRGLIDQELREDLEEEFEDQLLNGNGVGENFTGIANTANVLTQAWDTDIWRTTRLAKLNLAITGRTANPTAWVMNPEDAAEIDLMRDGELRFYGAGPWAMGPRTLWGTPIVESSFKAAGSAYLANWKKAVVWDRERSTISVSDSHADFFIRNMIAILAEMRAAFGVIRPSAFIEVDLSSGS